MALKLENGDYVKNAQSGIFERVEYIDELLQSCFVALNTLRGRFYPNKSFGSRIRQGLSLPENEYAFALACQALEGLDGVIVKAARVENGNALISLIINGKEKEVNIVLDNKL